MKTKPLFSTLLILAVLTSGCSEGTPFQPSRPQGAQPPAVPPGPVEFPPLTKSGRVFGRPSPLSFPLNYWTVGSRFVLFDDGTFVLQFGTTGQYGGRYSGVEPDIRLTFDGFRSPENGANATLLDDVLTVRYDPSMAMSDFEDAIYTLDR